MRLVCVDDEVPEITLQLLAEASAARGVEFLAVDARTFPFEDAPALAEGDMLYCAAVSAAAALVEQVLVHPGVATFYTRPLGPFFNAVNHPLHFQQLGLPTPRTLPLLDAARDRLDAAAERLGGYPLIVKVLGWSRGVGTLRVDSPAALYSLADLLLAEGKSPFLSAYVHPAVHWRVTVVGGRAVAAYRNVADPGDFRTSASAEASDYTDQPDPQMARLAVAAARAQEVELGGVDILEHESGRLYLLESNFPCYFAQAQETAGIDVAGAMLDHLVGKAEAILRRAATGAVLSR
ncbi:MAG: hypothetical protein JF588_06590 [Caulobacterales bacterium]|nr:hypothetical protein [Caulobacterales bacterium]